MGGGVKEQVGGVKEQVGGEARQDWDNEQQGVHCASRPLLSILEILHVKCQKSVFYSFSSLDHSKVIFLRGGRGATEGERQLRVRHITN